MDNNLPLRERKKYQTMLSVLNEFLLSLEHSYFDEIHIEDICDRVSISKVTFFRYFASKEEVLDYFVLQWCYQRSVEIAKGTYTGLEGIHQVFRTAAEIPHANKILISIIQYYAKLKAEPMKKELSEYERYIISQNSTDGIHINILPLQSIFQIYLTQMPNMTKSLVTLFSRQLTAIFYGVPFQVHIEMQSPNTLIEAYKDSLELLFGKG